ncbi:MAG: chemotaxis protein chel [Phenylobacterium zucineum]|nr:MAG: chemotaxis protein chel [Phenylobacterium zucineum]
MADLALTPPPLQTSKIPATPSFGIGASEGLKRTQIAKAAKDFEASFLSVMMGQMFQGDSLKGTLTGGEGEDAFKAFMSDAMAKQVVRSGGIGLAATVQKEMLKLQGLSEETKT